jgi:hypothetical protein
MAELVSLAASWVGVGAALLAVFAAASVFGARSLFTVSIGVAVLTAFAACALLALGQGEGGLALALLGGGVAPVLLLGGMLLSNRSAQPRTRGLPWLSMVAAGAAAAAMLWAAPAIDGAQTIAAPPGGAPLALAAIVFVAVVGCVALLAYGERGVLGAVRGGRDA